VTDGEIAKALAKLIGLWPRPVLTTEAADVLALELEQYSQEEFDKAVSILQAQLSGQLDQWRPTPAEVLDTLRSVRRSRAERARSTVPEPEPCDPLPWFAKCRRALEGAAKASAAA